MRRIKQTKKKLFSDNTKLSLDMEQTMKAHIIKPES